MIFAQSLGMLISASVDGTVSFFSVQRKKQCKLHTKQQGEARKVGGIVSVCYLSKHRWVANSCGRTVVIWEVPSEDTVTTIRDQPAPVLEIVADDRSDILIALLSNTTVHIWGVGNWDLRQVLDGRGAPTQSIGAFVQLQQEMVNKLLVFENRELGRVLPAHDAGVQADPETTETSAARYPIALYAAGNVINAWKLGADTSDSNEGIIPAYKEAEDLVCSLLNTTFSLVVTVQSMGTVSLFSASDGAALRSFSVGQLDAYGHLDTSRVQTDPNTGLVLPLIRTACFDCLERRLVIVYTDNTLKFWNFFAGQEVGEFEPVLPRAVVENPTMLTTEVAPSNVAALLVPDTSSTSAAAIVSTTSASHQAILRPTRPSIAKPSALASSILLQGSNAQTANNTKHARRITSDKSSDQPFNALADARAALEEEKKAIAHKNAKDVSTISSEALQMAPITHSGYRLISGIEQEGREKYSNKVLMLCLAGSGTIQFHRELHGKISEHATSVFRWCEKPWSVGQPAARRLSQTGPATDLNVLQAPFTNTVRSRQSFTKQVDRHALRQQLSDVPSTDTRNVLWYTLLDFNGNDQTAGMAAGPGCGYYATSREVDIRVNFLCVGYSDGTCIVWDADKERAITFIETSKLDTILPGMQLKSHSQITQAVLQQEMDLAAAEQEAAALRADPALQLAATIARAEHGENADTLQSFDKHVQETWGKISEQKQTARTHNSSDSSSDESDGGNTHDTSAAKVPLLDLSAMGATPSIDVSKLHGKNHSVSVDAAVGLYDPAGAVLIGACSDRYIKIWDCTTGMLLCSISYLHDDAAGKIPTRSRRAARLREQEEQILHMRIEYNPKCQTYILAAALDTGIVRVWELDVRLLVALREQLAYEKELKESLDAMERTETEAVSVTPVQSDTRPRGGGQMGATITGVGTKMAPAGPSATVSFQLPGDSSSQQPTRPSAARPSATSSGAGSRSISATFENDQSFDQGKTDPGARTSKPRKPRGAAADALAIAVSPIALRAEFVAHTAPIGQLRVVYIDTEAMKRQRIQQQQQEAGQIEKKPMDEKQIYVDENDESVNRKAEHWSALFEKGPAVRQVQVDDSFVACYYLLTSSIEGEVMLWTLDGIFVGQFGGKTANRWDLLHPHAFPNRWLLPTAADAQLKDMRASGKSSSRAIRSVVSDYINGLDAQRLRTQGQSGADRPSIAARDVYEQAVYEAQKELAQYKTVADMHEEVQKLTLIVQTAKEPTTQKQTDSYQTVNRAHPLIDVVTMPLPFDSPRVDQFHKTFQKNLEKIENIKKKQRRKV